MTDARREAIRSRLQRPHPDPWAALNHAGEDVAYLLATCDALQQERDELRAADEVFKRAWRREIADKEAAERKLAEAESQIQRLTEALRRIVELEPFMFHPHWDETVVRRLQEIAKEALASSDQEPQS